MENSVDYTKGFHKGYQRALSNLTDCIQHHIDHGADDITVQDVIDFIGMLENLEDEK